MLTIIYSVATLLSGLTYMLLRNPEKMEHLKQEVRTTFKAEDDIEMGSLAGMEYLNACMHMCPQRCIHPGL